MSPHPRIFRSRILPGRLVFVAILAVVAACAPPREVAVDDPEPEDVLDARLVPARVPASFSDDGDSESLRLAVRQSLLWLESVPAEREFDYGVRSVTARELTRALGELEVFLATDPAPEALREWVLTRFEPVETSTDSPGRVLVTGYFEPVIPGARERTERATVPVHARPDDLVTVRLRDFREALPDEGIAGRVDEDGILVPYFTRREIQEEGALDGRGLELAWVEDRVDLFFVEVQGSGAVAFPDGSEMRIGFAASNGHVYRSIGRLLIEEGLVPAEEMSMQAIRAYLEANPHEVERVLNHNPSYIFFRELDTPPVGSLGVPVTGGRSIATDYRLFPPGALAFLETTRPERDAAGQVVEGAPLRRFVLNQDTGGAIRGPARVDFFWGRGVEAEQLAGLMQQDGRLVFLVPR